MNEELIAMIEKVGLKARGKSELISHLNGEKLTQRQAIIAKCYDCTNYYGDGREDCLLLRCPLYPYMPYSSKPVTKRKVSKEISDAASARMKKMRAK